MAYIEEGSKLVAVDFSTSSQLIQISIPDVLGLIAIPQREQDDKIEALLMYRNNEEGTNHNTISCHKFEFKDFDSRREFMKTIKMALESYFVNESHCGTVPQDSGYLLVAAAQQPLLCFRPETFAPLRVAPRSMTLLTQ